MRGRYGSSGGPLWRPPSPMQYLPDNDNSFPSNRVRYSSLLLMQRWPLYGPSQQANVALAAGGSRAINCLARAGLGECEVLQGSCCCVSQRPPEHAHWSRLIHSESGAGVAACRSM